MGSLPRPAERTAHFQPASRWFGVEWDGEGGRKICPGATLQGPSPAILSSPNEAEPGARSPGTGVRPVHRPEFEGLDAHIPRAEACLADLDPAGVIRTANRCTPHFFCNGEFLLGQHAKEDDGYIIQTPGLIGRVKQAL